MEACLSIRTSINKCIDFPQAISWHAANHDRLNRIEHWLFESLVNIIMPLQTVLGTKRLVLLVHSRRVTYFPHNSRNGKCGCGVVKRQCAQNLVTSIRRSWSSLGRVAAHHGILLIYLGKDSVVYVSVVLNMKSHFVCQHYPKAKSYKELKVW